MINIKINESPLFIDMSKEKKYTIYFLETPYHVHGWNDVFIEVVTYFRDNYNANIIHSKGGPLTLEKYGNFKMEDCKLLIVNETDDILHGITFRDNPGDFVDIFIKRNNPDDVLLMSQFHNRFPRDFDVSKFKFKFKGSPFYTFLASTNNDYYYRQRQFHKNDDFIDKVFYGGSESYREAIKELRRMGICAEFIGCITHQDYMLLAIQHKMGIAIAGVGEICYRDIEYLSIGLPMLRLEYMSQLNPPLIPNYHYVAVDRSQFPWDVNKDRDGGIEYAEAYKNRFLEVKDDKEFLEFISRNGREYYFNYIHPQNRLKHLLNLLELNDESEF